MKRLLPGSIVAVVVLVSANIAGAQNSPTIVTRASTPKSPFREKQTHTVEAFDRQRALDERQKLMLDGVSERPVYAAQPAAALQPLPSTSLVSPPLPKPALTAQLPPASTVECDCESTERVSGRNWRRLHVQEQCASAREMFPHHAYRAPYGAAYYFRPYMAQHVGRQADVVSSWGGDRSNPYDNRFLQSIYAQPRE